MEGALKQHFGFSSFKPGQKQVIEAVLAENGRALCVFPTGGGKSLCYMLPAVLLPGLTVVISPLIALMKDQVDFLKSKNIAAEAWNSAIEEDSFESMKNLMKTGSLKVLFLAPEKLNNEACREVLMRTNISLLACDEAHWYQSNFGCVDLLCFFFFFF